MRVQRVPADDLLVRDGETAVLLDGMVVRLSELSAAIYDLTGDMVEVGRLARELEARFGAPEGSTSREATDHAVADLLRHGVLRSDP
jgi:hypothetical protein